MSLISKLSSYHSNYFKKFYNKKLCTVGALIGVVGGASHCTTYYGKVTWNWIIDEVEYNDKSKTTNETPNFWDIFNGLFNL